LTQRLCLVMAIKVSAIFSHFLLIACVLIYKTEFENIAADLSKPKREGLRNFAWRDPAYSKSHFLSLFNRLGAMIELEEESNELTSDYSRLSKCIMTSLVDTLLGLVHKTTTL
jgi:hypothetical protein